MLVAVALTFWGTRGRGVGADLDPAVQAMIQALPAAGVNWSDRARERWIEAFNSVIQVTNSED